VGTAFAAGPLPWALEAAVPTALLAATLGAGAGRPAGAATMLAAGALAAALAAGSPGWVFWVATAAGAFVAAAAGGLARAAFEAALRPLGHGRVAFSLAAVLALAAVLGAPRVRCSLGLLGYGERYLPRAAAADLAAVRALLPPPASLAVRVRGAPGFVAEPQVLHALDGVAAAARADPAVRTAMSIADVVKMVNRAFNDERPEFFEIPDDRALAGRYLALAYSPAFRRFVDRGFASTALWVQLDSDAPADLSRVLSKMRAALAERPVPGGTVELPAGDGAVLLAMAHVARRVAGSSALALLIVAGAIAAAAGWRAGLRALGAGALAAAVAAGTLGWTGLPVDLVSLPLLAGAALATAALGGLAVGLVRVGLALAGCGVVALGAPLPAAPLVASLLLGPALAFLCLSCAPRRP
jgi:hypothetical protein